jgi:hypothetical protein
MKTTILFSAIAMSTLSGFSPAVNGPVKETIVVKKATVVSHFEFFRIHRQGRDGVTATWGISNPGNDVSGFVVERTYDDPSDPYANWEPVSNTPCTNSRSYKCTDTNVFPGYLSYRVTAFLSAGGSFASHIPTIHIVSH